MKTYKILVVDHISEDALLLLKAKKNFSVEFSPGLSGKQLEEKIRDVHCLVVRTATRVTKALLDYSTELKLVARVGIGLDNIDVEECKKRGITVVNSPKGNRTSTAEHTLAMLLALARKIPQASETLKTGGWDQNKFIGQEINGKILGIIGLGNIGSLVAVYANILGLHVIACDPYLSWMKAAKIRVKLFPLDYVLKNSDYISLHVPLTDETRFMADKEFFAKMKPGSLFINCARGAVHVEEDLRDAVESGHLGGAALDVFSDEPLKSAANFKSPNFILTPHVAGKTKESYHNISMESAEKIIEFFR